jgi:hypothetical protein
VIDHRKRGDAKFGPLSEHQDNVYRMRMLLMIAVLLPLLSAPAKSETVSAASHEIIGKKVWANECDGKVEGLTSWNGGEAFPSLGIGHFIWYPAGRRGPFDELSSA